MPSPTDIESAAQRIAKIERRHEDLLSELDRLNDRIEAALEALQVDRAA